MKFRKTLFLFIFLVVLGLIAYILERPKDITPSVNLFPEFTIDTAALIDIKNQEEKIILIKTDEGWKLEDEQGFPVDPELIKKTLESIAELKKANNVFSHNPEKQSIYEVDPNNGIEIKVSDQSQKILANFFVGKTGPDFMSTYLRQADSDEVLLCEGYHLRSSFTRKPKNWYDLNITKLSQDQIEKIEINQGDKKLTLKKDQDAWQLIDPNHAPAKKDLVDDMVNTIARLRANNLLKADTLGEYELAPPKKQIIVSLSDGSEKIIDIGKKNEENQYYVKAEKDVVYLIAQYNINKLINKTFEELKEIPPQEEPKSDTPQDKKDTPSAGKPSDSQKKLGSPQITIPSEKKDITQPSLPSASAPSKEKE